MFLITKERGLLNEPANPSNLPLYNTLKKYQPTLDGSNVYDDLIDVYINQELDYKEENK